MRRRAILCALGLASSASACSVRPGSLVIFYSGATTLVCAGLSLLLTVLSFTRDLPNAKRVCLPLLILHPAWTMMGFCCDCGTTQAGAALLDALLCAAMFVWDLLRRRPDEDRAVE